MAKKDKIVKKVIEEQEVKEEVKEEFTIKVIKGFEWKVDKDGKLLERL
jgi:hypothetical protein|tara:strand:+ start:4646 stop:4789 length:144 start_codon:yes stop_codon:yes gene_type:complete